MAITNGVLIEEYEPVIRYNGLNTNEPIHGGSTLLIDGAATISGLTTLAGGSVTNFAPVAVNATATLTAAQILSGYITSTSASAVTMTMPTGTLLGAAVGAKQGTILEFYVDNTAGANTVTMAVGVNGIISAAATAGSSANFGLLTVPSGVTGVAEFTVMFSSATAYVFSRTA